MDKYNHKFIYDIYNYKSRKRNLNHLFSTDEETDTVPKKFKSDKNADESSSNEEIEIEQVEEQVITS